MNTHNSTVIEAKKIAPINHDEAFGLAEEAYRRLASMAAQLGDADWERPTTCEGWTVRDLLGHLVGAMRAAASKRELVGQLRGFRARAKRTGESETDAMTAIQIERSAPLTPEEVVAEMQRLVKPAARGRHRIPAPIRNFAKIGVEVPGLTEQWTIGYLNDVILTRDSWLHLIDLHDALGLTPEFDAGHDARIVEDLVGEWCRRHDSPIELRLAGPAGGVYVSGDQTARVFIDLTVADFARQTSGRAEASHELLGHLLPY